MYPAFAITPPKSTTGIAHTISSQVMQTKSQILNAICLTL